VDAEAFALGPLWLERQRSGHVRECHGDLHLDNLVRIDDEVTAFDCLEFDVGLRSIDTMGDIAFTLMDLKARGRPDLAHGLLDDYLQASGDYAGVAVLRFYEVYRALVRALVDGLRRSCAAQAPQGSPYMAWALGAVHVARSGPPPLVLMHGLSGSGKSTVARALVEQGGAIRLRSDVERKRMFGLDAFESSTSAGQSIYGAGSSGQTYTHLLWRARALLATGYPVIVDAAFLKRWQRQAFLALAVEQGAPLTIVDCDAPEAALHARLLARTAAGADPSEADVHVLRNQIAHQDPLGPDESAGALRVNTDAPLDVMGLWRQIAPVAPRR